MIFKVRSMSEYIYIFHRCHKFSRTFAQFHYYNTTLLYCSPRFLHYFNFFFSTGKSRPHQLLESFSPLTGEKYTGKIFTRKRPPHPHKVLAQGCHRICSKFFQALTMDFCQSYGKKSIERKALFKAKVFFYQRPYICKPANSLANNLQNNHIGNSINQFITSAGTFPLKYLLD